MCCDQADYMTYRTVKINVIIKPQTPFGNIFTMPVSLRCIKMLLQTAINSAH